MFQTAVYVITTASGKVLQQPVDSADMDIIDTAGPSVPLVSVPGEGNITTMDTRLLGARWGENICLKQRNITTSPAEIWCIRSAEVHPVYASHHVFYWGTAR